MTVGDQVYLVCKYEQCENEPRLMNPSAAAYQDFCSKSCASKEMWKSRVSAAHATRQCHDRGHGEF